MIGGLVNILSLILLTLCVVNMYNVHTRVIPMISAFAPEERWSVQMVILARSFRTGYRLWFVAAGRTAAAGNSHQDVIQSVYRSPTTVS